MTFVVHKDPHPSVVKEAVCRNGCGATVGYVPNDIQQETHTDYGGGSDVYNYITCACCSKKIFVK